MRVKPNILVTSEVQTFLNRPFFESKPCVKAIEIVVVAFLGIVLNLFWFFLILDKWKRKVFIILDY